MATSKKFMREPKMFTTEPSDDEVGHGMKRGGHAHKKHMALGGAPMMAPRARPVPLAAPMARVPMGRAPMMRKSGGHIANESAELKRVHKEMKADRAEERNEHAEIKRVEKELKHHEHMKARSAHKGLKAGGAPKAGPDVMGGLAGGVEATRHDSKKDTGGVRAPGYKHGGKAHHISGHPVGSHKHHSAMAKHHAAKHAEGGSAHHKKMHERHKHLAKMAKGGMLGEEMDRFETKTTLKPKIDVNDKVVGAKQTKRLTTKTGGVSDTTAGGKPAGYKRGGHLKKHHADGGKIGAKGLKIAEHYMTNINDDQHPRPMRGGTKGIKQEPAGYKKGGHVKHHAHGGHVSHHTTYGHHDGGHTHMHQMASKHSHGHEKVEGHPMKKGGHAKHHMKKGGKCNY